MKGDLEKVTYSPNPLSSLDEDALQSIVDDASLPALLATLAFLLDDDAYISPELQLPPFAGGFAPAQGGMSAEQQELARTLVVEGLRRLQQLDQLATPKASTSRLWELLRFFAGDVEADHGQMLVEELSIDDAESWSKDEIAPARDFFVVVIGAGVSGLAMARKLELADVPYVVLERNPDVGGVWWENTYPGCRLDSSNFTYSYTFAQKKDWHYEYATRDEVFEYLGSVADQFELRSKIKFNSEVTSLSWDADASEWNVTYGDADGSIQSIRANVVVTAIGQLNDPRYPDFPGLDSFAGEVVHTARWRSDFEVDAKRVAVLGTGASGFQVVPAIADRVAELHLFQRSAPWMVPTPKYVAPLPAGHRWLLQNLPFYQEWYRVHVFWTKSEGLRPLATVDPEWARDNPGSISSQNDWLRGELRTYMLNQYSARPDLAEKVIPQYPPYGKRMLRDNGQWAAVLQQPNVNLVTDDVSEITPRGVRTADGEEHAVDAIIYATGFHASDFLASLDLVEGRGGISIRDEWQGDAKAYLGAAIPGFPNLFCVYGPNTNLVVNGSVVFFAECTANYISEAIRFMLSSGVETVEVKRDVYERYNEDIDSANRLMAWGTAGVSSWYKNALGRVSQNWPHPTLDYWKRTRNFEQQDYEIR